MAWPGLLSCGEREPIIPFWKAFLDTIKSSNKDPEMDFRGPPREHDAHQTLLKVVQSKPLHSVEKIQKQSSWQDLRDRCDPCCNLLPTPSEEAHRPGLEHRQAELLAWRS